MDKVCPICKKTVQKGVKCRIDDEKVNKKVECKYFIKGFCRDGKNCHFYHSKCWDCGKPFFKKESCTEICQDMRLDGTFYCTKRNCHHLHPNFMELKGKTIYWDDSLYLEKAFVKETKKMEDGSTMLLVKEFPENNTWKEKEFWITHDKVIRID